MEINSVLQLLALDTNKNILEKLLITYEPFNATKRSNADIYWLFKPDSTRSAGAALIRYYPGGKSPTHKHTGYELIYVLEGEMITSQGIVKKGDLVVLPPESIHASSCEIGCIALIIWEKPVVPIEVNKDE